MSSKETILNRIRASKATPVQAARQKVDHEPVDLDRFCQFLADYRATVHRPTPDQLSATLVELTQGKKVVIPPDFPTTLLPEGLNATSDQDFTPQQLDEFYTALTLCAVGIEETGTLVLNTGPGQGRRALTLIPDHHICLIHPDQVVHSVAEAVHGLDPSDPLTFISGPSATSDIELVRVEGVHGPRKLDVILCAWG